MHDKLILFSVKHEVKKSFFMICELWRTWIINRICDFTTLFFWFDFETWVLQKIYLDSEKSNVTFV